MQTSDADFKTLALRIRSAIESIQPDLRGQTVLTEAASGPFMATAVAAAVAGASRVIACTKNSRWGTALDIERDTLLLADLLGVKDRVEVRELRGPLDLSGDAVDVVTNLGFIRPISRQVIAKLSSHAAIALMWEPWEFRSEDIDVQACVDYSIPIIATNEHHPQVATFKSVGVLAVKLLLECKFEVLNLNVLVVGSNPFGQACADLLDQMGARVVLMDPIQGWNNDVIGKQIQKTDAIVVIEHRFKEELFGTTQREWLDTVARRNLPFVHICGNIDATFLELCGISKHPKQAVPVGYMTTTTAHVGSKPVVDLHVAGLHVASLVARKRAAGVGIEEAVQCAVDSGYGLRLLANNYY